MNNKFYITSSIPYVNAKPHIGFAYEIVQTDTIARYHRLLNDDTYFLTGTDENALKNVQSATDAGKDPKQFVDELAVVFEQLKHSLNLSFDQFIRTTSPKHFSGAQKLWTLFKKDDIYKKSYKGLYCVGCEQFLEKEELVDGLCPIHLKPPQEVEEENYFFKLSAYQNQIEDLISSNKLKIVPEIRKNEVLSFVKSGLKDISISRTIERAKGWGVPVPGDPSQIQYVWVDALSNYITALDFDAEGELYQKYWLDNPNRVHVIGKDIVRFHAVYWPAFLLSANIPLPKTIYVHGFITTKGQKISKSLGNVLDPFEQVEKFGTDAVRYFLLREIPSYGDGDYTEERFKEVYNADLANGLGNLISRVAKLAETLGAKTSELVIERDNDLKNGVELQLENFRFDLGLEFIWGTIAGLDKYLEKERPWVSLLEKVVVIKEAVTRVREIAEVLQPFLPNTSKIIYDQFNAERITSSGPLFPRLA